HQRANPPGLVARQEHVDNATRGQDHGIVRIDVLRRRRIGHCVEAGLAVSEVERAGSSGDRVPRPRLEQPWRPWMVDLLAVGTGRRTRPEHALLRLDLLVADTRVIDDAALRRPAQLFEDLFGTAKSESSLPAQRASDILQDTPVLLGVSGRRDGLVDLDDSTLRRADDPFVLLVLRAG